MSGAQTTDGGFHELQAMDIGQVRREWQRRLKSTPPKLRSKDLLIRALTYRLQSKVEGDLAVRLRREADVLAKRFEEDRGFRPTPGPNLKVGSSVIREWGGVRHEVAVTEGGFEYAGQTYRSLSAVAMRITGTKWNGLAFFELRGRRR